MNNIHPTITIDLILDRVTTKDVLHGILHSILFHRLFGAVKPRDLEVLNVTMPGVSNPEIERMVNKKVETFWKGIETGTNKRGQIVVTLSEKRAKKSWFYTEEEDVPWEQWIVNAELRQPKSDVDRLNFHASIAASLTKSIHTMLEHTSSEKGRAVVPLITKANEISPFPLDIAVKIGGVEVG
ncbi:DUF1649-domain-containing protein [Pluteus cervinus]|uniref:DUF1649-domain-containing protein n=1 Tax=Pluteus cervinus TaxID=181527 RepID=A0ACD3AFB4_9AGAR|nr:DUF1649-domain-containing protein [Pluteus cervinus]